MSEAMELILTVALLSITIYLIKAQINQKRVASRKYLGFGIGEKRLSQRFPFINKAGKTRCRCTMFIGCLL